MSFTSPYITYITGTGTLIVGIRCHRCHLIEIAIIELSEHAFLTILLILNSKVKDVPGTTEESLYISCRRWCACLSRKTKKKLVFI